MADLAAEVKNSKVAVDMVLFLVDGALVAVTKSPATDAAYTAKWDTTTVSNGEHKLRAAAVLADGKVLNSEVVVVTVENEPPPATE